MTVIDCIVFWKKLIYSSVTFTSLSLCLGFHTTFGFVAMEGLEGLEVFSKGEKEVLILLCLKL